MNSKRSIVLSTVAIAAIVVLFASGPIVANHQASAVVYGHHGHYGHYYRHYHGHYRGHYYRHYHRH
jgi:hypothetical protein